MKLTALISLAWGYLRERKDLSVLSIIIIALAVAMVLVTILVNHQMQGRLERDAQGIDMVVGAKGSPLQLVLASVYHLDVPTGNISLDEANKIAANPMIKQVVPLSMGDTLKGYRIIGTQIKSEGKQRNLVEHYGGKFAQGRMFEKTMEAVLGAEVAQTTGLAVGQSFAGSHGLGESGEAHADTPFTVTGILQPTGTALDRLVITSTQSVWSVHGLHDHDDAKAQADTKPDLGLTAEQLHELAVKEMEAGEVGNKAQSSAPVVAQSAESAKPAKLAPPKEITAMLVQFASPLAAATLPRQINAQSALQAASPALETGRLMLLVGAAGQALQVLAVVLAGVALICVFIAIKANLASAKYDLATLRLLGAKPHQLGLLLVFQGVLLAVIGGILGFGLAHGMVAGLGAKLAQAKQLSLSGGVVLPVEFAVLAVVLVLGVLASTWPAWSAYRISVADGLRVGK
jgi:putative ABC transport system permease protein